MTRVALAPPQSAVVPRPAAAQRAALARLACAAGALLIALVLVGQLNPYLGDFGDDAEFMVLGQGLATGAGYAWVNSPDHPAHNRYPPGYPLLVAAAMTLTGTAHDAYRAILPAKTATLLTLPPAAALLWLLARRRLSTGWSALVVALFVANPVVLRFSVQVMSDVPYIPVFLAAPAWEERYSRDRRVWPWLVLGALLALGAYVRSVGLAVAALALAWCWLRRSRRGALAATGSFAVLTLPWGLRNVALAGGWRYLEELTSANYQDPGEGSVGASDLVARALDNLAFIAGKPGALGVVGLLVAGAGVLLLLWGAARSWRTGGGLAECAAAAICAAVLFWPIKTGRYLLPVIPLFTLYVTLGALQARAWWARRAPTGDLKVRRERVTGWAVAAGLGVVGLAFLSLAARDATGNLRALRRGADPAAYFAERPEWSHYIEAAEWLRQNAGPDDVVMARRHFALYVYSGHYVDKYRFATDEAELAYLTSGTARKYVVDDAFDYLRGDFDALPLALRARGGNLIERYETAPPEVRVWELVRP